MYSLVVLERTSFSATKALQRKTRSERIIKTLFKCVNIQSLEVSGWDRWNDRLIRRIVMCHNQGYFHKLHSLSMRDCNEITIEGMRTLLHALKTKICYLDMEDCHKLGPECLPSGINKLKVLKIGFQKRKGKLESGNIVEHLTRGKRLIAPKLEWLSIQHRETQSLGSIERLGATLTALDLRGCTDIPQSEYKKCAELPELKQLLTGTGITSEVLCSIVHACKKLEVLDMTGSELSKECIEGICNNLKSLQKLKLAKCKSLTNDGVQRILASLPNLRLIDLSHCWKLSDALCNHMPQLAATDELTIGIHNCSLDTSKLALTLAEKRPQDAQTVTIVWHQELKISPS